MLAAKLYTPLKYASLLALLIGALSSATARANCASCDEIERNGGAPSYPVDWETTFTSWPPVTTELPTNAQLVLQQYGPATQPPLSELAKRAPYLETDTGARITLDEVARYEGDCMTAQVVLAPRSPLPPGATVTLFYLDDKGQAISPPQANSDASVWTVAAAADQTPPTVATSPRHTGHSFGGHGCGVGRYAQVELTAKDTSATLARVTLTRAAKDPTVFLIPLNGDTLQLGHDACSGAFLLTEGAPHNATFELIDAAGHVTPVPQDVDFTLPPR